ncbi:MAG: hypothetical protein AB4206_20405 [Xenococcaceae cyanobacterium]
MKYQIEKWQYGKETLVFTQLNCVRIYLVTGLLKEPGAVMEVLEAA